MYFTNRFHLVKQLNNRNVVKFKDPLVEELLIQHNPSLKQGNITLYDLSQYKDISGIFQNTDIQYNKLIYLQYNILFYLILLLINNI